MDKKQIIIAITALAIMPLTFAQAKPIKAEEAVSQDGTATQNTRVMLETDKTARKDALAQKMCEVAQKRISAKMGQLQNNRKMYQRVYGNMDSRLTRLVERLNGVGLDTTKLQAEITTLNSMTQKLYADYDAFISAFRKTEAAACGKTKEEFRSQFENVRSQIALIRSDRAAIKNFFLSNIKPELQRLKAQLDGEIEIEVEETVEIEDDDSDDIKIKKKKSSSSSKTETETVTSTQTSTQN